MQTPHFRRRTRSEIYSSSSKDSREAMQTRKVSYSGSCECRCSEAGWSKGCEREERRAKTESLKNITYNKWFIKPQDRLKRSVPQIAADRTRTPATTKSPSSTTRTCSSRTIPTPSAPSTSSPTTSSRSSSASPRPTSRTSTPSAGTAAAIKEPARQAQAGAADHRHAPPPAVPAQGQGRPPVLMAQPQFTTAMILSCQKLLFCCRGAQVCVAALNCSFELYYILQPSLILSFTP